MNHISEAEVRRVSEFMIQPQNMLEEWRRIHSLGPWDIAMLSVDYIQKGLFYTKPQQTPTETIIAHLKDSLSQTLTHFPTLSGRLVTKKEVDPPSYYVSLDCRDPPGALFIHAVTDLAISDIISLNTDIPKIMNSFFAFDSGVNHDGHTKPLLAVQVTELTDGIFIGCSLNHCMGDGTSYWHFFNSWSEISRGNGSISRPPVIKRVFLNGHDHIINLPFSHHDEFLDPWTPPPLREIMFHFSAESIAQLKKRANLEANTDKISSFQALSAFVWRCIIRARNLPADQQTNCRLAANNRSRLRPAISENYFGNCINAITESTTAAELLANNLGWSAWKLHMAVASHGDESIRTWMREWMKDPKIYQTGPFFDVYSLMMGSSPRFDMYGNDFGWGKPVAARSGIGNKFEGKVSSYPGREGGGSVNLEVCLCHESMSALLLDDEFTSAVYFRYVVLSKSF